MKEKLVKVFTYILENALDVLGIGWQISEVLISLLKTMLEKEQSKKILSVFYEAVIRDISEKYNDTIDIKEYIPSIDTNNIGDNEVIKKFYKNPKKELKNHDKAILLLCLYKNINSIEDVVCDAEDKQKLKDFLLVLHKVMQKNIHIIFSLSDGKQALIYSTFFTSISFELQEIQKLIEAGVYQNKPILELEKDALWCEECEANGQLKIVEENGIILVKAFCPYCDKVSFPKFNLIGKEKELEKGTGELTGKYKEEVQAIAKSISEKLNKIKETTEKIDKTTTQTNENVKKIDKTTTKIKEIVTETNEYVKKLLNYRISDENGETEKSGFKAGDEIKESIFTFKVNYDEKSVTVTHVMLLIISNIIIPSSIRGLTVNSIGNSAFRWYASLINIEIPNSVTSIGDHAFDSCSSLTSIKYDGTQEQWEEVQKGKDWCPINVKIIFTPKVVDIKTGDKIAENNVNFKANTNEIAAFKAGDEIIENGLKFTVFTVIKDEKFVTVAGVVDKNAANINIPSRVNGLIVDRIGESAFADCYSLTSIFIPNSVTLIGDYAFKCCGSLTSIEIPNSVTSIGHSVFTGCDSLTCIEIPNSVTSIGDSAFFRCSSLTSIVIPNSVTSIGDSAFYECSSLTSIVIPNSVTSIGDSAFWYCSSLTYIKYEGTQEQWEEVKKGEFWCNKNVKIIIEFIEYKNLKTRKSTYNSNFFFKKVLAPAGIAAGLVTGVVTAFMFTPMSFLPSLTIINTGSLGLNFLGGAFVGFLSTLVAAPLYFKLKKLFTTLHYNKYYGKKADNIIKLIRLDNIAEIDKLPIMQLIKKIKETENKGFFNIKKNRNRWHGVYDFLNYLDYQIRIKESESDIINFDRLKLLRSAIQKEIDTDIINNYVKKVSGDKYNENLDIHCRRLMNKKDLKNKYIFESQCEKLIKDAWERLSKDIENQKECANANPPSFFKITEK